MDEYLQLINNTELWRAQRLITTIRSKNNNTVGINYVHGAEFFFSRSQKIITMLITAHH